MSLPAGHRLGQYEVLAPLGAGGMGEVYRAVDTRLHRDVALKVIPERFAQDAERLARFQREAQALATLNHPNIATIYGIADGALVMEFVDGPTLASLVDRGPLPVARAVDIARQIAEALEAAHDKGVIHRDLKPGNIKITPEGVAKVLDFGLARIAAPDLNSGSQLGETITMSGAEFGDASSATGQGAILGTAAYMSPEQARGDRVDKRADIWSFGVVLYQMLTGRKPFPGRAMAEILARIVGTEPDYAEVPARLRPLLQRCLEKDPKRRLRDIGEARLMLEEDRPAPLAVGSTGGRRWWPWLLAGMAACSGAGLALFGPWAARSTPASGSPQIFADLAGPPVFTESGRGVDLSRDGTRLVYVTGTLRGDRQIATRLLSSAATQVLEGTQGAAYPFLSPDGRWVAFFQGGKLKKMLVTGGAILPICDAPAGRGGAWSESGVIVFAPNNRGTLARVPDSGGIAPVPVTTLTAGENCHRWPHFLPGGEVFVYTAGSAGGGTLVGTHLVAQRLTGGPRAELRAGGVFVRPLSDSQLGWVEEGAFFTAGFDARALALTTPPTAMGEEVQASVRTAEAMFASSGNGLFAWLPGRTPDIKIYLEWFDADGIAGHAVDEAGDYAGARLSPDGGRLAYTRTENGNSQVWVHEFSSRKSTRLTFVPGLQESPAWTPDGTRIAYRTGAGMAWVSSAGGTPEVLTRSELSQSPLAFSPGHRHLYFEQLTPTSGLDILSLELATKKITPVVVTPHNDASPALSPDGQWLAWQSDENAINQLYVMQLATGAKWQVTQESGVYPVWSANGQAIYYQGPDYRLMEVRVSTQGGVFTAGRPAAWSAKAIDAFGFTRGFDPAPHSQRFVALHRPRELENGAPAPNRLMLQSNYLAEVQRRQHGASAK